MKKTGLRKILSVFLVTICLLSLYSSAEAKAKKKKKETAVPKIEAVKKEERLKQAAEKLNNTQWVIRLIKIPAEIRRSFTEDVLRFAENKIESKLLAKEGFTPTSYSLSLKGENMVIWETMQTDAKGNLAFWKGEMEGERMRGVLSRQPKDKPATDYTFVSISKETIKEEKTAAQKIERQSQEGLEEKPTELKKEEKKKRWVW